MKPPLGAEKKFVFSAQPAVAAMKRVDYNFFMNAPTPFPHAPTDVVSFDRRELGVILSVYGRMVAAGEWRDYALNFMPEVAVFSIFRRAAEVPIFRVEKRPALRSRQGMFAVLGGEGQVLRRGHDLAAALRALEKPLRPID